MGIKFLYSWISRYHPTILHSDLPTDHAPVSTLAIDFNNLIHICAQEKYGYGNYEGCTPSPLYLEEIIGRAIEDMIRMYRRGKAQFTVILCVDGVASSAKMYQQRQRRFKPPPVKRAFDHVGTNGRLLLAPKPLPAVVSFDSNLISPGTPYMNQLCRNLRAWLVHYKKNNPAVRVIWSSEEKPSEGEMKIFQALMGEYTPAPGSTLVIYGQDADLFLLTIQYQTRNPEIACYLHRPKSRFPKEYDIVDIRGLWNEIPIDSVDLFIYCMSFGGNDFTPNIPSIYILRDLGDDRKRQNGGADARRIDAPPERNASARNASARNDAREEPILSRLFETIHQLETSLPHATVADRARFLVHILTILEPQEDEYIRSRWVWQSMDERHNYYGAKLPGVDLTTLCAAYFESLEFVYQYYRTYRIPDWNYMYPYLYAPFMKDLKGYLATFTSIPRAWDTSSFPAPLAIQLIRILPCKTLREIYGKHGATVVRLLEAGWPTLFPAQVDVDMDYKQVDWEGIVKIPSMEEPTARAILEELKRNKIPWVGSAATAGGECYEEIKG